MFLGFAGAHRNFAGVHACEVDLKHINNFSNLTHLSLYGLKDWKNTSELQKLTKLEELEVEGSFFRNGGDYSYPSICKTNLTEKIPPLKRLRSFKIETSSNIDLNFLGDNSYLETFQLSRTKIKSIPELGKMVNLRKLELNGCLSDKSSFNSLTDVSSLENCVNLEVVRIGNNKNLLDFSFFKGLTKIKQLTLTALNSSIDLICLKNLTSCEFLELNLDPEIDIAFIRSLVCLRAVYISGCDLTKVQNLSLLTNLHQLNIHNSKGLVDFSLLENNKKIQLLELSSNPNLQTVRGMNSCVNLKKIDLRKTKNLVSVVDFPVLKCLDIQLSKSGIQNLDFLENTQIITEWKLPVHLDFVENWSRAGFYVSSSHANEHRLASSAVERHEGLPLGFDKDGYVIPKKYADGSASEFETENTLDLSHCENLQNIMGLKM